MAQHPYVPLDQFAMENPLLNHSSRVIPEWIDGRPQFKLDVSPDPVTFGPVTVDEMSANFVVKVTNGGFDVLTILGIAVDAPYLLGSQPPRKILPGQTIDLLIRVNPSDYGLIMGNLLITTSEIGTKKTVMLAQGVWDHVEHAKGMLNGLWEFIKRSVRPPLVADGPEISLNQPALLFKDPVIVGTGSQIMTTTISNVGNQTLTLSDPVVLGDFEIVP